MNTENGNFSYISDQEVKKHLNLPDLIDLMEKALADFSSGRIAQPVRQLLPVPGTSGYFGAMQAAGSAMGVKIISAYPENAVHGLPTHAAMIVLFDAEYGQPLALLDADHITKMRTAAVSAVATRHLAKAGAKGLAILGSGEQARTHIEALKCVMDIHPLLVWSRTPERARKFAEEHNGTVTDAKTAVERSDVIVTCTAASEPVLQGAWLRTGSHVNAVGWRGRDGRELDAAAMKNVLVVDSREAVRDHSGNVRQSDAEIYAELGEIVAGKKEADRSAVTIFDSVGLAVEDIYAANMVYQSINDRS